MSEPRQHGNPERPQMRLQPVCGERQERIGLGHEPQRLYDAVDARPELIRSPRAAAARRASAKTASRNEGPAARGRDHSRLAPLWCSARAWSRSPSHRNRWGWSGGKLHGSRAAATSHGELPGSSLRPVARAGRWLGGGSDRERAGLRDATLCVTRGRDNNRTGGGDPCPDPCPRAGARSDLLTGAV